ncbi:threonylcarbamoyladenosine tRNA methylthiotransferase MtaB [Thermodesulfovibrio aggregans]|uniref:tRNA-2-methylthio-N(6)-dimethylallyladenosine synthase n=1 Tax=Thermodesulfovibrio aggregans TaxID=86166 RepID=A0A0U9HMG6_9BACT|nr:tRNA (N(6)-L-threonylcarbamoyladenosine(37)-C(2))-methylthiotransferase MtaB [Thermodesulfovibrio aggregans]GAQ94052.1 threonylcarbamoyladenosine tRNA methylthiotransferase MtaB [Thermodesulfovibrio aggregans]
MKVSFFTYGCKVNQAESQKWEKFLKLRGYTVTTNPEEADFWIINTCAVTHKAEVQSRQIIEKAKKSGKKVYVTGCFVELCKPKETENLKVFLNFEKDSIINNFESFNKNNTLNISRHRAIVKIQDGCNHFCSYCIVPYLRGKPRSYKLEDIIEEINDYLSMGIKEIILSGINIGLYGIDLEDNVNLNTLLKQLLKQTTGFRIRLSSIEVNHIDEEFLEIISDSRICKHLHIPLQHGSDRILNLMNRAYNSNQFLNIIEKIFKFYPDISIGTDVIVGFPSETDEDFKKTLQLIERIGFSYLHVFSFSKRPFTKASQMPEQIPENIKKDRANYLIKIGKDKKSKYIKKFLGSELDVIVENKKNGFYSGTSDNYIKCFITNSKLSEGDILKVIVNSVDDEHAFVSLINNK